MDRRIRIGMVVVGLGASVGQARAEGSAEEPRFEVVPGGVRAVVGEEVRWAFPISMQPAAPLPPAPVRLGDTVVFCGEGQLYEASATSGKVQRRLPMPGVCAGLAVLGDAYEVSCASGTQTPAWSRAYLVRVGEGELPLSLSEFKLLLTPRRQADELAKLAPDEALAALDQRAAQDPTNPWLDLARAEILQQREQTREARQAVVAALGHDRRYDLELMMMSRRLGAIDRGASDEAFLRGMKFLLERGYEPELATGLITPVVLLGRPNEVRAGTSAPLLDLKKDHAQLERHASHLLDLAPNAEGSTWFFATLARAAEQRGDKAAALRWGPLGDRDTGTQLFSPGPPEVRYTGLLLQLMLAFEAALLMLTAVKTVQSLAWRHEGKPPWWVRFNPFGRWSRWALVGFLLALVTMMVVGQRSARGVAILGAMASAPSPLLSGDLAHPALQVDLQPRTDPASRFVRALSLHKSRNFEDAAALYEQLSMPEATSNLAAIAAARGDEARARELWQRALTQRPDLDAARWGLGQSDAGPRAERWRRYGVTGPLLALPSQDTWNAFWRERAPTSGNPLRLMTDLAVISPQQDSPSPAPYALLVLTLALGLLVLLALFWPRRLLPAHPIWGKLGSALSVVTPGAAHLYGPSGPFFAALTLFLLACLRSLQRSQGLAVSWLDALVTPAWARMYGLAELTPEVSWLARLAWLGWGLLALNVVLVLLVERPRLFGKERL